MKAGFPKITTMVSRIFDVTAATFTQTAIEIFNFQYVNNPVYRQFADILSVDPQKVTSIEKIPFLPINFFKTHKIASGLFEAETVFESSGTTQTINSRHLVKDLNIYKDSFTKGFELFYGQPSQWCIIGLLPSYLERQSSSLVVMVNELIQQSNQPESGFYLYNHDELYSVLQQLEKRQQKTLLIGVTFALLDFAEKYKMDLRNCVVMETGGMKGRREEWTRAEVHDFLQQRLGVAAIHSEYGMTELLSQGYSSGNGIFNCPPWMRIFLREEDDPLTVHTATENKNFISGVINVIDLANIYSCSFIATDDVGKLYADNSFEISGRLDNSDLRGCSLMVV